MILTELGDRDNCVPAGILGAIRSWLKYGSQDVLCLVDRVLNISHVV